MRPAAPRPSSSPALRLTAFGALLAGAMACGTNDRATEPREMDAISGEVGAPSAAIATPLEERKMAGDASVASSDQLPRATGVDSVVPNMIIRNGSVSIEVDSLELAMSAVRALAARLGGYVGNVSTSTGEYSVRSAALELKIPAARFDEALSGMTPLGKVEQSTATAEDVGEEFVDLRARVANARRLEERLVTLLATRAGKLEEVLAVERELARIREEIERHEGRLRFLRSRVAMSTLAVTVHEAAPLVSPNPGTNVIGEAFRDLWRNFVNLVAGVIASLGVVIPVGVAVVVAWRLWKRRTRTT